MKRFFCFFILCCMFSVCSAGVVVRDSLQSNVLGTMKYFSVYLPDAFLQNPDAKFPVLYLLHGLTDNDRGWIEKGQMDRVCDELMASGEATPMIVIMPGAGDNDLEHTWNGYFNMPGWAYEDFFFRELMPTAERKYRILGDRSHRAIAGLSMGGGGSTSYAQRHADLFCACYVMSPWLDNRVPVAHRPLSDDRRFSALTEAVAQHSPIDYLEHLSDEGLREQRSIAWFLDCGDDDHRFDETIRLYQTMRKKQVPAQLRVRNGGHTWEYWHYALRLCLPFVSRTFAH